MLEMQSQAVSADSAGEDQVRSLLSTTALGYDASKRVVPDNMKTHNFFNGYIDQAGLL